MLNRILAITFIIALIAGCSTGGDPKPDMNLDEATQLTDAAKASVDGFISESGDTVRKAFEDAKGILSCPTISKGGFIVGVESGKCVLSTRDTDDMFYGMSTLKGGFLAGMQQYSMIMLLNSDEALQKFTANDKEWELGVDAGVAVIQKGATGQINTSNLKSEIVTFIYGEEGLMGDASFQGTKFKKLVIP